MSMAAQFYFGQPLREVKAKAAQDEREAAAADILAYAATLPAASAAPYQHAAQLVTDRGNSSG